MCVTLSKQDYMWNQTLKASKYIPLLKMLLYRLCGNKYMKIKQCFVYSFLGGIFMNLERNVSIENTLEQCPWTQFQTHHSHVDNHQ